MGNARRTRRGVLAGLTAIAGAAALGLTGAGAPSAAAQVGRITLEPGTATNLIGTSHTVVATVRDEQGAPLVEELVQFSVISGPNVEQSGEDFTDGNGQASFTYESNGETGTDTIEASFFDGEIQHSATATKTWEAPEEEPAPAPIPSPPADVGVAASGPAGLEVGETGTYVFVISNAGPGNAPDTTFSAVLPANLTLLGSTSTRATCTAGPGRVDCSFGTLGVGDSVTVELAARADAPGPAAVRAEVATSGVDWNLGANNTAIVTTQVGQPPPDVPLPAPGEPTAIPIAGIVLVNGEELLVPRRLRSGDIVDVSRGRIELRSVNGTGQFHSGVFRLIEFPVPNGYTQLHLFGGDFPAVCGHSQRRTSGAEGSETHVKKPVRRLWGNARGRFRTKGRYASATVRGTLWLTSDRCDGTLIAVRTGRMSIFDTTRRITIILRAFDTYLAPPLARHTRDE